MTIIIKIMVKLVTSFYSEKHSINILSDKVCIIVYHNIKFNT